MDNAWSDAAVYLIAAIIVLAVLVGASEWLRHRRERNIYKQTRLNASNTVRMSRKAGATPREIYRSRNS